MSSSACPCGSGNSYNACCGPLHKGSAVAKTPKQLIRSRYCAYALGGNGDYLLQTWHPDSTAGLTAESLSAKTLNWQGLAIVSYSQNGDEGTVEFEASFIDGEGKSGLHHEVSRFVRQQGKWLYLGA